MAWRRLGDKPLSEPMMVGLLTHICITRPQWVKPSMGSWWGQTEVWLISTTSSAPCIQHTAFNQTRKCMNHSLTLYIPLDQKQNTQTLIECRLHVLCFIQYIPSNRHMFSCFMYLSWLGMINFTYILQGYFTGTGATIPCGTSQPKLTNISKLTHLPLVPHICASESGEHWFR